MISSPLARRWILPLVVAAVLAGAASAKNCIDVSGEFTAVAPDDCGSPVGICTHGTLTGGFPSTYDFVALTLVPAGDPAAPNKLLYTGESVITTESGAQLFGEDTGFLLVQPDGTALFETTVNIVGGTRQYKGGNGMIVATGVLDLGTGATGGAYTGTVCKK